jgi:hypothetical protein
VRRRLVLVAAADDLGLGGVDGLGVVPHPAVLAPGDVEKSLLHLGAPDVALDAGAAGQEKERNEPQAHRAYWNPSW